MDSAPRFELFAFWRTSATYRVRVALNVKGLVAQERLVNLDAGEQRGAAFLKINPLGAIPALIDHAPGDDIDHAIGRDDNGFAEGSGGEEQQESG